MVLNMKQINIPEPQQVAETTYHTELYERYNPEGKMNKILAENYPERTPEWWKGYSHGREDGDRICGEEMAGIDI